jgi:hypothetical protein
MYDICNESLHTYYVCGQIYSRDLKLFGCVYLLFGSVRNNVSKHAQRCHDIHKPHVTEVDRAKVLAVVKSRTEENLGCLIQLSGSSDDRKVLARKIRETVKSALRLNEHGNSNGFCPDKKPKICENSNQVSPPDEQRPLPSGPPIIYLGLGMCIRFLNSLRCLMHTE